MPLLGETVGGQRGSWGTEFDVSTANGLYWRTVPITVRLPEREEHVSDLTVRILSGVTRSSHAARVLRVWLSDESDACFLHTLDVSEEDFAGLKAQQGILVDFGGFPAKLIGLLDRCISAAAASQPPRFQAVLSGGRAGESSLQLLETNDFKQLPHLSLAFRPGIDAAVKQFLAFRLGEVTTTAESLSAELRLTKADRDAKATQVAEAQQCLADAAAAAERVAAQTATRAAEAEATAVAAKSSELAALRTRLEGERGEAEARLRGQLETAGTKGEELGSEVRRLTAAKCALEAEVSELRLRLSAAEAGRSEAAKDAEEARARQQAAAKDGATAEVALSEARAKLAARDEKVAAQQETLQQQAERVCALEASVQAAEQRAGELKEAGVGHAARADAAAAEAARANQIIDKLSAELRVAREKGRRRGALAARQEAELAARSRELAALQGAQAAAERSADNAAEDAKRLKAEVQELQGKLAEARQGLDSNEQMIRWLNNQLNDATLSHGGGFRVGAAASASAAATSALPPQGGCYGSSNSAMTPPPWQPNKAPSFRQQLLPAFGGSAPGSLAHRGSNYAAEKGAAAAAATAQRSGDTGVASGEVLKAATWDRTPAPRTPRPPTAAARGGPASSTTTATSAMNAPNSAPGALPAQYAAAEAGGRSVPAAAEAGSRTSLAAVKFGSAPRAIYRSELAKALTAGQSPPQPPGGASKSSTGNPSRGVASNSRSSAPLPCGSSTAGDGTVVRSLDMQFASAAGSASGTPSTAQSPPFGSGIGSRRLPQQQGGLRPAVAAAAS